MTRAAFSLAIAIAVLWISGATACDATRCQSIIEPRCRLKLGAGAIAADPSQCEAQATDYERCLIEVAKTCSWPPGRPLCEPEDARQLFAAARDAGDPKSLAAFIQACPKSPQAVLARALLSVKKEDTPSSLAKKAAKEWRIEQGDCWKTVIFRGKDNGNFLRLVTTIWPSLAGDIGSPSEMYDRGLYAARVDTIARSGLPGLFKLDGDRLLYAPNGSDFRCIYRPD